MIITGIGARQTPSRVLEEMKKIGEYCRRNGVWVRSGHADGADWAFEQGAQEACIAYLPWQGFNSNLKSKAKLRVLSNKESTLQIQLVRELHPAYDKLSPGAWLLMRRNVCQIMGETPKSPLSNAVVCWTKDGGPTGGTGMAIRLARKMDIPIINMQKPLRQTAEEVIDLLRI